MILRPLTPRDWADAHALYRGLNTLEGPPDQGGAAFEQLLDHPGTHVWGAAHAGKILSMATLHLLPNMTYGARPYGLIENVATLPDHQGQGYARAVLTRMAQIAWAARAYKIMLLSGQANKAAGFYQALGFDADEKQGFILRAP